MWLLPAGTGCKDQMRVRLDLRDPPPAVLHVPSNLLYLLHYDSFLIPSLYRKFPRYSSLSLSVLPILVHSSFSLPHSTLPLLHSSHLIPLPFPSFIYIPSSSPVTADRLSSFSLPPRPGQEWWRGGGHNLSRRGCVSRPLLSAIHMLDVGTPAGGRIPNHGSVSSSLAQVPSPPHTTPLPHS